MSYCSFEIENDPLLKADPKIQVKVKTEKNGGDAQKKNLKKKECEIFFQNKMLTRYHLQSRRRKTSKFNLRSSTRRLHEATLAISINFSTKKKKITQIIDLSSSKLSF